MFGGMGVDTVKDPPGVSVPPAFTWQRLSKCLMNSHLGD